MGVLMALVIWQMNLFYVFVEYLNYNTLIHGIGLLGIPNFEGVILILFFSFIGLSLPFLYSKNGVVGVNEIAAGIFVCLINITTIYMWSLSTSGSIPTLLWVATASTTGLVDVVLAIVFVKS